MVITHNIGIQMKRKYSYYDRAALALYTLQILFDITLT